MSAGLHVAHIANASTVIAGRRRFKSMPCASELRMDAISSRPAAVELGCSHPMAAHRNRRLSDSCRPLSGHLPVAIPLRSLFATAPGTLRRIGCASITLEYAQGPVFHTSLAVKTVVFSSMQDSVPALTATAETILRRRNSQSSSRVVEPSTMATLSSLALRKTQPTLAHFSFA